MWEVYCGPHEMLQVWILGFSFMFGPHLFSRVALRHAQWVEVS